VIVNQSHHVVVDHPVQLVSSLRAAQQRSN
jgi:hypothetical protein